MMLEILSYVDKTYETLMGGSIYMNKLESLDQLGLELLCCIVVVNVSSQDSHFSSILLSDGYGD